MKRTQAAVAYGSNLGDRAAHIETALRRMNEHPRIHLLRRSSTIETDPVGGPPQPRFLNGVVLLETDLDARRLLDALQAIEHEGGRVRAEVDGPRTIDLDLILYGEQVLDQEDCRVPHPRAIHRGFVLGPLAEVAGEWRHPEARCTVAELHSRWRRHVKS